MSSSGHDKQDNRHFTHGTSASTADMAVGGVRHEDKPIQTPHTRPIDPSKDPGKVDQLAEKLKTAENRQEALIDEAVEESFPASDPASPKHIT